MRSIIILATLVGSIGFIVYHTAQFFLSLTSSKARFEKYRARLAKLIEAMPGSAIIMDEDDFALTSARIDVFKNRRSYRLGYIHSIYKEVLFKTGSIQLPGRGEQILIATNGEQVFTYFQTRQKTDVLLNGSYLGSVDAGNRWISPLGKQEGMLQPMESDRYVEIVLHGEKILTVYKNDDAQEYERAFQSIRSNATGEPDHRIALALYVLIS